MKMEADFRGVERVPRLGMRENNRRFHDLGVGGDGSYHARQAQRGKARTGNRYGGRRRGNILEVVNEARAAEAEAIIVTEKDAMNLSAEAVSASALPVYAAQIEFRCEEEIALKGLVLRSMLRGRKKS